VSLAILEDDCERLAAVCACVSGLWETGLARPDDCERLAAVCVLVCQVYERLDWRDLVASRSITANCGPNQTAFSKTAAEGASLHLVLKESERLCKSVLIYD